MVTQKLSHNERKFFLFQQKSRVDEIRSFNNHRLKNLNLKNLIFTYSPPIGNPYRDWYGSLKREQRNVGNDPYDSQGFPPPNEAQCFFYIIIKHLKPSSARLDAWNALHADLIQKVEVFEERREGNDSTSIYIGFTNVSAASTAVNTLPEHINGRTVWIGHARSAFA